MTALRRGFKSEANEHAVALRRELQLSAHAPLCPWKLANHLEVPVFPLSVLITLEPAAVRYLIGNGRDQFSAVTIFLGRHGRRRVIYHNDGQAMTRQAANIAHELAHAILCHPPTPPFAPDPVAEQEARWLGPALLVSQQAALRIAQRNMTIAAAAEFYGVSEKLMSMRLNVTGACVRVSRYKRRK